MDYALFFWLGILAVIYRHFRPVPRITCQHCGESVEARCGWLECPFCKEPYFKFSPKKRQPWENENE